MGVADEVHHARPEVDRPPAAPLRKRIVERAALSAVAAAVAIARTRPHVHDQVLALPAYAPEHGVLYAQDRPE
jgi:hypothetical protein